MKDGMWLVTKKFDLFLIIGPSLFSSLVVILLYLVGIAPASVNPLSWLILVVFIDVSHVWSTLFRTYLHRERSKKFSKILFALPVLAYFSGVVLHSLGAMVFWRFLAYLAVFHFIRQQYGIYKLYYNQVSSDNLSVFDKLAVYAGTILPIVIWHLEGPQSFSWFLADDFYFFPSVMFANLLKILGPLIFLVFFIRQVLVFKYFLLSPHLLFQFGTILSWWCSIVWIKTDWAFSVTNIVSHGIPYFALIYVNDMKKREKVFWPKVLPLFSMFLLVFTIAYIEEATWAVLIWRENLSVFPQLNSLSEVTNPALLALLVPLLALPQFTHYLLDGYIWKNQDTSIGEGEG